MGDYNWLNAFGSMASSGAPIGGGVYSSPGAAMDTDTALAVLSSLLSGPSWMAHRDLVTGEPITGQDWIREGMLLGFNPLSPAGGSLVRAAGNIDPVPRGVVEMGAQTARVADDVPYHLRPGVEEPTPNNPRGLPMDQESRMLRAGEMGFDTETPFYHGSGPGINAFDLSRAGTNSNFGNREPAAFFTDNPAVADSYHGGAYIRADAPDALSRGVADMGGNVGRYYAPGSTTYPAFLRSNNAAQWDFYGGGYHVDDMSDVLRSAYADADAVTLLNDLRDPGVFDAIGPLGNPRRPSTVAAITDPTAIRSPWATFDPERAGEADLLASTHHPLSLTPEQQSSLEQAYSPTNTPAYYQQNNLYHPLWNPRGRV